MGRIAKRQERSAEFIPAFIHSGENPGSKIVAGRDARAQLFRFDE
jgi:hypothetical protein